MGAIPLGLQQENPHPARSRPMSRLRAARYNISPRLARLGNQVVPSRHPSSDASHECEPYWYLCQRPCRIIGPEARSKQPSSSRGYTLMNYSTAFRTVHFDGCNVRLVGDVGGDASDPPVILLHGGGQTRHSWHGAMHRFIAEGYFVVNLEARGHGDSDWATDGDYSLDRMVEDLMKVTATLANPPALVGASMGGITALAAVGESARQIASALILVDGAPRIETN